MRRDARTRLNAAALCLAMATWSGTGGTRCAADETPAADRVRQRVQPILEQYCYGCHGYGASEADRTLDEFASEEALVGNVELWHAVLKNVRAGIMPPAGEDRPAPVERTRLFEWIKFDAFGIDPHNPDPGRVTMRRLNRVEYRNTVRDLIGIDYNTLEQFPPDDTGYGFDNIGDVLSMSPLLLEKYLQAAETIVERAVVATTPDADEPNYRRFFPDGPPPEDAAGRVAYACRLLGDFARRAMVAMLASPRFVFRTEYAAAGTDDPL